MSKNKTIEVFAKILFQYHQSHKEFDAKAWDKLEHERTLNIYGVSKREYFRMAKGIYYLLQSKELLDENKQLRNQLKSIDNIIKQIKICG